MSKWLSIKKKIYKGRCSEPLCRLEFTILVTEQEFKLFDLIECRRCSQKIPASNFKEVIVNENTKTLHNKV